MPAILQFLPHQDVIEPTDLPAMAAALDDLVERLKLSDDGSAKAATIIDLSRAGKRDANWLRA